MLYKISPVDPLKVKCLNYQIHVSSIRYAVICGGRLWALEWAWQICFNQSIGIDETNTFKLNIF